MERESEETDKDRLERMAACLRQDYGAERIWLFGSMARGTADEDSDLDLLIVSRTQEQVFVWASASVRVCAWETHAGSDGQLETHRPSSSCSSWTLYPIKTIPPCGPDGHAAGASAPLQPPWRDRPAPARAECAGLRPAERVLHACAVSPGWKPDGKPAASLKGRPTRRPSKDGMG